MGTGQAGLPRFRRYFKFNYQLPSLPLCLLRLQMKSCRHRERLGVLRVDNILCVPVLLLLRAVRVHGSAEEKEGDIFRRSLVGASCHAHLANVATALGLGLRCDVWASYRR